MQVLSRTGNQQEMTLLLMGMHPEGIAFHTELILVKLFLTKKFKRGKGWGVGGITKENTFFKHLQIKI